MQQLPETGYLRLKQIIGKPETRSNSAIAPIIPVSSSTWWLGVKSGRFPKPVKLGPRTTAWRVEDIRRLIDETVE
jgi:predicted DNA-binding transcriptional regulator AlpA